jgi:hypothetical protein
MGMLTQRVHDKLTNDRQWKVLRDFVMQVSEVLSGVSPDIVGELAGNYVKFAPAPTRPTYAAVWPRVSSPK